MNHGMKADKYEISVNYKVTNERPYLKLRKKFAAPRGNKIFPIGEQKKDPLPDPPHYGGG